MILFNLIMHRHTCTVACVVATVPDLRTLAGQKGWTSLMLASDNGHVEAVRVLIEKGANVEAAATVRLHSHATTHARSKTLVHTRMHTRACEHTI
jgi:ankyrin repeat protein